MHQLRLSQLSITSRMLISPITILLLLISVSVLALISLQKIDRDVTEATTQIAPVTEQAQAVSHYLSDQRILVLNYQRMPQPEQLEQFALSEQAFSQELQKLTPWLTTAEQQAVLGNIQQLSQDYSSLFSHQLVDLINQQQNLKENLESIARGVDRAISKLIDLAITDHKDELILPASQLQSNFQQTRIYLHQYLAERNADQIAEADFYLAEAEAFLMHLQQSGLEPRLMRRVNQLNQALQDMSAIMLDARTLTTQGITLQQQLDKTSTHMTQAAQQLNQGIVGLLDDTTRTVQTLTSQTRTGLISASAIAAITGLLLALIISQSVRKVLIRLNGHLNDIASGDGDLTSRLPDQGGKELNLISRAFNRFMKKLQGLMRQLTEAADNLASASSQLAANSEQSVVNARHQQNSVHSINEAIQQLGQQIDHVSHNADRAKDTSTETEQVALTGQQRIEQTNHSFQELSRHLEACADQVQQLNTRAGQINDITDDIQGLADQTSLLALNAAIEAARAGEHGRGFAVVADEVRHLSGRTHEMTQQITGIIEQMATDVQRTCQTMEQLQDHSGHCQQQADITRTTLDSIADHAQHARAQIQAIADQSDHQQQQVQALQMQSQTLQQTLDENRLATEERARASSLLNKLTRQLQHITHQFRID